MDEFIFTQFSCAKYGVLDLLIEYTIKIDVRINGGYIYNITIVNSANGNKAHMVIVQKIILPYEYRSLSNKKIKDDIKIFCKILHCFNRSNKLDYFFITHIFIPFFKLNFV